MKLLLSIVIIVVIAVVGSRVTFINRRLPLGFRNLIFTGTEYIFIGILLGRTGLNIIDSSTLNNLTPFVILGLSWIGFLFGLQFNFKSLRGLPRHYFSMSAVQALTAFLVITPVVYIAVTHFFSISRETALLMALTLGSAGCCTAQSAIAVVNNNYRFQNRKLFSFLRFVSAVDGVFALIFFSLAFALFSFSSLSEIHLFHSLYWLLLSFILGALSALLFFVFGQMKFSKQEFLVFLLGVVLFSGGLAVKTNGSPLLIGFLGGLFAANISRHRLRALDVMVHSEKAIYIILLVIIGAAWTFRLNTVLIVAGVYVFIRMVAKLLGTLAATSFFKTGFKAPAWIGLGLVSEGGFSVAIVINFSLVYPALSDYLVTVIVLSMFINEILSPRFLLFQLENPKPTQSKKRMDVARTLK
jgi:Kef-type K+ transport system membrane component KefB